jgi:pimeloyl-ACP methyl ester carboxylesterase
MADLAGDVRAVLDDVGIERAHVIGASMGGMIVQHVALDFPERVRSLTLCCTSPQGGGREGPPPWRMLASIALRPLLGVERTLPIVAPLLYSERTLADRERFSEEVALRSTYATSLVTAPAQFAAIARHDARDRLRELETPVLVVHGEEDRLVPASAGRALAALIPDAELALLPRCGHVLTTDCEEEAAAAIRGFLDRVEG